MKKKTSKILGDLEAIANERVEQTLGKVLSVDSMIPFNLQGCQTWFLPISTPELFCA